MTAVLEGTDFSDAEIQTAVAGVKSAILERLSPDLRALCIDVIVKSIGYEWILVVVAGAL
jgi:hypothetical protein